VFKKRNVNTLPKHQPYNYTIDLVEGAQPPFKPIYNMSQNKLITLYKYFDENFEKGFIWHSKFLDGAPIFFVKKKDGSLRMCVNYHGFSWFIVKNWYPLLLISWLLDQFSHDKVYTNIDLHWAYNLVHIWEGNEWKTTFQTRYNHFEYVVMSFSLINAPIVFQHLMNDVFHEYLDDFVVCYIDDIIIFSKNMEVHERHVCLVLEKLQEVRLYVKLEKCEFHQSEVQFLGYVIFGDDICMDPHKV
jgi:hypothetical protein